jgi:hypothetical protein
MEYVRSGDLPAAVASMISDLGKHHETASPTHHALAMLGTMEAINGNRDGVRRWIEGFN